mmetsp:Transcript_36230/g.108311  ORF Transcript_36230/g.108311 Transcript_36230/m.108311 type:complete len:200 (+) Transcript_36230:868-1467(+)
MEAAEQFQLCQQSGPPGDTSHRHLPDLRCCGPLPGRGDRAPGASRTALDPRHPAVALRPRVHAGAEGPRRLCPLGLRLGPPPPGGAHGPHQRLRGLLCHDVWPKPLRGRLSRGGGHRDELHHGHRDFLRNLAGVPHAALTCELAVTEGFHAGGCRRHLLVIHRQPPLSYLPTLWPLVPATAPASALSGGAGRGRREGAS